MARANTSQISWTTSHELYLDMNARPESTKSARLQGVLREAIRAGRLEPGTRLPASRALASDLGMSRGVVVEAYEQLVAEGYLVGRHGSGTVVADHMHPSAARGQDSTDSREWRVDFEPGRPALDAFPRSTWAAAVRAAVRDISNAELSYPDPLGNEHLRTELAAYLRRVRGANVAPDDVAIVTGYTHGLSLLASAAHAEGTTRLAVEDPGAYVQRAAATRAGLIAVPMPVDGDGARTDLLVDANVDAVMVTPAHQYPVGGVLAPNRRAALIDWVTASPVRAIFEDDYDAEFRYDRSPIGTIQGLAPAQVALGGSVSKSLAPGLRIGWTTVPARLIDAVRARQEIEHARPSAVEQRAFADLLSSGRYDRHIRRMRNEYRRRRDAMLEGVAHLESVRVGGVAAGLHMTLELTSRMDEGAVVDELAERGVRVQPLARYRIGHRTAPGVVLGYAHLTVDQIAMGMRIVADVLTEHGDLRTSVRE